MALLCVIALIISVFLFFHALSGKGLIGCAQGSSCNAVLGSRWSLLLGAIPISAPGICIYSFLLVCILGADSIDDPVFEGRIRKLMLIASGAVSGAAAWFIIVQELFIGAFCPYCMSVHCCGIVLSGLIIWDAHRRNIAGNPAKGAILVAAGIASAAALALFQVSTTPRSAYDSGSVSEKLPNPAELGLPVIGDSAAECNILLMYDYRCSHCRKIHTMLPEVVEKLGGRVSFTLCPTPLGKECNPYVNSDVDLFKGSCLLDKCALAVWRIRPDAFPEMDEFLFENRRGGWYPREEDEATKKAAELIGAEALEKEIHSEWMRDYLSCVLELFARTSSSERAAIPRFVLDGRYMVPEADNAEALTELIRQLTNNHI